MKSSTKHALNQIALDGPSASGKTTIGKMLAERLGFGFLDTGLMYRAVTLVASKRSIAIHDVDGLTAIAEGARFEVRHQGERDWRLVVDGADLTECLHTDSIDQNVSHVSALPGVRRALVRHQRAMAERQPIVMAGRDIGTVVLTNAPLKIFLVASAETRARRRAEDDDGNVDQLSYEETLKSLRRRDEIDSTREDSPLKPADDAKIIDNGKSTSAAVVEEILSMIGETTTEHAA